MKTKPSENFSNCAVVELHYRRPSFDDRLLLKDVDAVHGFLRKHMPSKQMDLHESFWVILLTTAHQVLGISKVASGTTKGVQMNPKGILQLALLSNASAIIVAHNHPSGSLIISKQDMKETQKLKRIAKIMEIDLLDHFMLTSESFCSFAEQGKL